MLAFVRELASGKNATTRGLPPSIIRDARAILREVEGESGVSDDEGFAGCVALAHPTNARLIAAAPALLEALGSIVEDMDDYTVSADDLRHDHLDKARAAIRAAKGGEQ